MTILQVLVLFFQLQHLHASTYPSSPLVSNPEGYNENFIHKGNMVKQEMEILEEKAVSNVNRRGGGGGHGGHASAAHGGGHGSSHGRGVGGGDSSVLPKYGGVVAGAGAGGAYEGNRHTYGKHSGVSSCCVHPYHYYQLFATIVLSLLIFI